MDDDFADILGSSSLPVRQKAVYKPSWSTYFVVTIAGAIGSMVLYAVAVYSWNMFMKKREKSYRLSMRRRHGIPDSDHRPFNVAYAAALRSRQDKEKQSVRQHITEVRPAPQSQSASEQGLRQRQAPSNLRSDSVPWPGSSRFPGQSQSNGLLPTLDYPPSTYTGPNLSSKVTFADGFNASASPVPGGSTNTSKSTSTLIPASKHLLDDDEGYTTDNPKKTRIEGDELIDGDEDAAWSMGAYPSGSRGPKRGLGDEQDDSVVNKKACEKRSRKVSNDFPMRSDDGMEVDHDQSTELLSTRRGKKRDRGDAGSTFGGDDSLEFEATKREKKRRNKRRSDAALKSRGTKRERDVDDDMADEADETSPQIIRKKRGKKAQQQDDESVGDTSSEITLDKSRRRDIGEQWESNGVQFKIGLNGQRLRKTLVKKSQKYPMPQDSIHPDRDADIEIFVESWLTDEEYKDMKEQRRLPHLDTPPSEPATPDVEIPESPLARSGKHLLWESTASPSPRPTPEHSTSAPQIPPVRRSITSLGLGHTAFPRRIASTLALSSNTPGSPSLSDSTNSLGIGSPRPIRGYSKWEKQDLEAKAMSRIREANQKKQDEQDKLEQQRTKVMLPPPAPVSSIPSIALTKPSEDKTGPTTATTSSLFKSSPLASAAPLSTNDGGKATVPNFFAKSSTPSSSDSSVQVVSSGPVSSLGGTNPSPSVVSSSSSAPVASTPSPSLFPTPSAPSSANIAPKSSEKPMAPGMGFPSGPSMFSKPSSSPATAVSTAPVTFGAPSSFSFNSGNTKPTSTESALAAPSQGTNPSEREPAKVPSVTKSAFNFNAPSGSSFDRQPPTSQPTSEKKQDTPTAAPPLRFNLNFNKPSTPSNNVVPNSSSKATSSFPTPAPSSSQATSSPFGAKTNVAPITTPAPASTTSGSQPAFSFAFGKTPSSTGSTPAPSFGTTPGNNVFGGTAGGKSVFGASSAPMSSFGSTPAGSLADGADKKASTAPPSNNMFGSGNTTNKDSGEAKSLFGATANGAVAFGATTTSSAFGAQKDSGAAKTTWGTPSSSTFGTNGVFGAAEKTADKEAGSKPSSAFGSGSGLTGNNSAKDGEPKPSLFGGASTGSAFGAAASKPAFGGFGTGATFGTKSTEGTVAPAASPFSFGSGGGTGSLFGAKPADTSSSIFGAKPTDPSSNPFTTGASTNTNSPFGNKAESSTPGIFGFGNGGATFGKPSS